MNAQLLYSISTYPFPLQASGQSGSPNVAQLTVVATNNTGSDVILQGVTIKIPVGQGAVQLTNDAKTIGPVSPVNWTLKDTQYPAGFVQYVLLPNPGYGTVAKNGSLNFIFNNIQVNSQTGQAEIDVTEGSNNCVPPNCPVAQLFVTKFPNGWGQVSFWVDHPDISAGGSDTLHWSGPAGATYSIEYYDAQRGTIVNVPAQGQPPLSNQGQYPAQSAPPLILQQTTTFTLSVAETIGGQSYRAQMQITVTVQIPPPVINSFEAVPSFVDAMNPGSMQLRWVTTHVTELIIADVGAFKDKDAESGSCRVAPMRTKQYFATAYGLSGYTGRPEPANTWLNFGGVSSSGFLDVWNSSGGELWMLSLPPGKSIFGVNMEVTWPDGQHVCDIFLTLQPGVQIADLGTARDSAGYIGTVTASYGTELPMPHIWRGEAFHGSGQERPKNVGATWAVKFSEGLYALLWLDSIIPDNPNIGLHRWQFTFKWIFYYPMLSEGQAKE